MPGDFVLSQTDGRPMYLQIIEQIKKRITLGDWPPGYKLPSIREFAVDLRVSVITVKRAYQDLESEKVIVTQQGKGSFVSEDNHLDDKLREQEMDEYLRQAIKIGDAIGFSLPQVQARLTELSGTVKTTQQPLTSSEEKA
jgi:GntR family transcriptional regulator